MATTRDKSEAIDEKLSSAWRDLPIPNAQKIAETRRTLLAHARQTPREQPKRPLLVGLIHGVWGVINESTAYERAARHPHPTRRYNHTLDWQLTQRMAHLSL